jgi:N-acetylglucosamine kinase-like BadF-type ATPase
MFLGMDGGGTHSTFVVLDRQGRERARLEAGSAYYPEVGIGAVRDMLCAGVRAALGQAGVQAAQLEHAFFGLPMHGEDDQTPVLDQLPAGVLPAGRYTCGNDMICGWAGSLGGGDGINVVAGTGSIGYGEFAGRSARCGGWGELFSDEGSAYWIARAGLQLFSRMSDGRAPQGPLLGIVRGQLGARRDLELGTWVARELGNDRSRIAGLARLVHAAAVDGDGQALAILQSAGRELALVALAIRQALAVRDDADVRVSYSGGVFDACSQVTESFAAALAGSGRRFTVTVPRFTPELGAALYAARLAGQPVDPELLPAAKKD